MPGRNKEKKAKVGALDAAERVYVPDRSAWRKWLRAHRAKSTGIWLVFDKKSSRPDRLKYGDAVEEALCFGWVDSLVRPLDDMQYMQYMSPRKPKSAWSKSNKDRVERLIAQGLMAKPGLAAIELAKKNGSWTEFDAIEALIVPDDLAAALDAKPVAARNFAALPPVRRKQFLYFINNVKRPENRAKRIKEVVQRAAKNQRIV
jgi:uncharacterized protein YdeI (YjbR/CyaY-like superfamily)